MQTKHRPRTNDGPRRVQAVDHAIDVLEGLAEAPGPIGVTELSRQLTLSKASVHHILATLEARGLVMRDPGTSLYRLGWGLYELGSRVVSNVDVSRVSRPFLDALASRTGESVLLGVRDGRSVLYLDRGDAPQTFHMVATAGRRSPLHATASGKVLLAFAGEDFVREYLAEPLEGFTPDTVTDPRKLGEQLAAIRADGFAACWQERELGLCSVAVPLRDYSGETIAALTLAAPAGRLTPENVDAHLVALRETAAEIEAPLGAGITSNTEVAAA
jgi:IclR family transcriptional regulator, KDG regulon repressor